MLSCTVKGFLSSCEGKFTSNECENLIIMGQVSSYVNKLYEGTRFIDDDLIEQGWIDYVSQTDISN